jgi:hypothetical protein
VSVEGVTKLKIGVEAKRVDGRQVSLRLKSPTVTVEVK